MNWLKLCSSAAPLAAGLVLLAQTAPAQATVVNIDATSSSGTAFTIATAGRYKITWIGVAQGGAYDSAYTGSAWSDAWYDLPPNAGSSAYSISTFTTNATYGSAAASLAAYQSQTTYQVGQDYTNGVPGSPYPITTGTGGSIYVTAGAGTYHLLVLDQDNNRENNLGGVSLSITAVPEPASWALMIFGVGLAGAGLRVRRRRLLV